MSYSLSEENYLKAIFFLSLGSSQGVSTTDIASRMETKASSVTDMVRKLSDKGCLNYKKYQGARLTELGREVAIRTIRKHRLWEVFLVEKLHFKWDEVHDIAEQLEHIKSGELTDRLESFLGFPKFDPHGDPIPNKHGQFPSHSTQELSDCEPGDQVLITGVKDTSPEFLQWLERQELHLGTGMIVREIFPFDQSVVVAIGDSNKTLSQLVAQNLFVKKITP
ncbi:MAG: metal-dependent transcriptional regulator [Bacteroidota bacterium]|nr:metal-dependent transcriptional regulator [Bacteroidota bacterium]MDX5404271.1 metal-dependent transcriptional regulator [Bacteroidota bacterium]MDX5427429.1 metal-dependent transcriptional regulator [Bacteroidota bacterium]MDX5447152.1 metal-dependent transcriptional regulator [Bacteroidota bacterium]MDX5505374.1 metal-dependent transcriptional regulator [Bacteroidota bacterium]